MRKITRTIGATAAILAAFGATLAIVVVMATSIGGTNFSFGDGSVRSVRDSISGTTWQAMGSRSGGEIVSVD
jgi:prepilin-type processing-associated H-X9-DG protein